MRIVHAKTGMVLAQDLTDERGNLLLEKGIALTASYIARLKNLGVQDIYVEDAVAVDLKQQTAISPEIREHLTSCLKKAFEIKADDILDPEMQTIYFRPISQSAQTALAEITKKMPQIINIHVRQPGLDDMTHAVNVCLLSMITGLYLKLPRPALHNLAVGALLHDIGKAVVSLDGNPADERERHLHTLYGYNLLLSAEQTDTIARIAAEHHEACDGSGYPFGLDTERIHPLSRIVTIANDFDRAVSQTPGRGLPLNEIVENMMAACDSRYDPSLLRAFFHTIAVYPVGSVVRLNTGVIGHVIQNQPHFPLRPTVRVPDKLGHTDIDLSRTLNVTIVELIEQ